MACLYCGKEIGPFRILRDKEFCSSAHRRGYRTRLGRALDQISAHEPPPAPIAAFIPYKPFAGNNCTPSCNWTFERHIPEVQLLSTWRLAIIPVSRERAAPAPVLQPRSLDVEDFEVDPEPWATDKSVRHLSLGSAMNLTVDPEDQPLSVFEEKELDPVAAGPAFMEAAAADWLPDTWPLPNADWDAPVMHLPGSSKPVRIGSMALCGAGPSLAAAPVEAFLPPGPGPTMLAYTAPVTWTSRWVLRATDWEVVVHLADSVAAPSAQAVESFLPAAPQAQILAWPKYSALPQLQLAVEDKLVATGLAEPAMAPSAQPVEAFLPSPAEPQLLAWPFATALPRLQLGLEDWLAATAMADAAMAPAAQAVESFLPAAPQAQMLAWPVATALPQFQLAAAEDCKTAPSGHGSERLIRWMEATALAEAAMAPAAQAVESFLPSPAEAQILAWPLATALPQFQLDVAEDSKTAPSGHGSERLTRWMEAAALAEAVMAPVAQAVESFLPAAPQAQMLAWPVTTALPQFQLAAADWQITASVAEAATAPAAQAVENFLPTAEAQNVIWPATATVLPRFTLGPATWALSVDSAEIVAAPAAQSVESFPRSAEPQIFAWPLAVAQVPDLTIEPTEWVLAAALAEAANAPAAQAVESFLPTLPDPCALPLLDRAPRLPEFSLVAIAPEPVEEFVAPVTIADACESWMPSPAACEAVRDVIPAFAGWLPAAAILSAPALMNLSLEEPAIRWSGDWRQSAKAEPVLSFIAPQLAAALPVSFPVAMPETGALQRTAVRQPENLASPSAERYLQAAEPSQAALPAIAASYQQSASRPVVLHFPAFGLEHTTGNRAAAFQPGVPSAMQPAAAELNPGSVVPQLASTSAVKPPASMSAILRCGLPMATPLGSDFICQRTPMAPIKSLQAITTVMDVFAPKFVVRPIFERVEEFVAPPPKPVDKTPAFAEIFELSKAARKTAPISRVFTAGKLIAASLIVGIGMWFGAGSAKITRQLLSLNTSINGMGSSNTSSGMDSVASVPSPGFPSPKFSAPKSPSGPIAAMRHAIQGRAAVEFNDTFKRMEAWGASAMTLPAGWTRNPEGYVRTGQLALYGPARTFADYRLEFFGQIEKKSMSWAIRANDNQNYYGMKMSVIEPGLRPVVAMVHYAVVGGKKMQSVTTPLSVMMHNNEPYHVSVDVKGNRVVTSIEGQEVDSWTSDALKVGGVGFFSEVGESARLYWMKVSKNQDWLGRVCAYLSNESGSNTAELWRDEMPHAPAQPSEPALPPMVDATMAAAEETEEFSHIGPQRARILKIGRTELCRS